MPTLFQLVLHYLDVFALPKKQETLFQSNIESTDLNGLIRAAGNRPLDTDEVFPLQ